MADDAAPFPYLRWAKAHVSTRVPRNPLSLGYSGLPRPDEADVPGLTGPLLPDGRDAQTALEVALAEKYGTGPGSVHLACGTSHANFMAYLTFARGERVAVETPAYEALFRVCEAVGAEATPFRRSPERGWRIDPDSLEQAVERGARLLAVTDLHNPSGKRLHERDLDLLVETAERIDALVLVDEVYADLDPLERPTAALRHPRVLVTNSLTKAHGLGDLRAGWILGHPDRIASIDAWDDLVCPGLPPQPMRDTLAFLPHARKRLEVTRARCARLTDRVDDWVQARDDMWWTCPDAGFTGFLRVGTPDAPLSGDALAQDLREQEGIVVIPGSFFQLPHWIRISYLLEEENLDRALDLLGQAIDRARALDTD